MQEFRRRRTGYKRLPTYRVSDYANKTSSTILSVNTTQQQLLWFLLLLRDSNDQYYLVNKEHIPSIEHHSAAATVCPLTTSIQRRSTSYIEEGHIPSIIRTIQQQLRCASLWFSRRRYFSLIPVPTYIRNTSPYSTTSRAMWSYLSYLAFLFHSCRILQYYPLLRRSLISKHPTEQSLKQSPHIA